MHGRGHKEAVGWLVGIAVLEVPKVTHDWLSFVVPLVSFRQHGHFTDGVERFVETFDVGHVRRCSKGGLVVVSHGIVRLNLDGIVQRVHSKRRHLFKKNGTLLILVDVVQNLFT